MCASLVHYGIDETFRIPVFQHAGFEVSNCNSIPDFTQLLQSQQVQAIVFAQHPIDSLVDAARKLSTAPLVYFASSPYSEMDHHVDMVIAPLTSAADWLSSIQLLVQSQRIREQSAALRASSGLLRSESAAVRARTRRVTAALKQQG